MSFICRKSWCVFLTLLVPACGVPAGGGDAGAPALPAGAEEAAERLDASPRHGEWVSVPVAGGDSVRAWVVHPERPDAAPVVVVVHEIYGLTRWIRAVADQLAADGFIAVAPDLLTGKGVPADETGEPRREPAVEAVRALEAGEVHARLRAAADWAGRLPSSTGEYGIVGFCWGGTVAFEHAARFPDLGTAVVYYGSSPEEETLRDVRPPVLGLYGGDDARVNATIPRADSVLSAEGRIFEAEVYEGAGHGFLRQQDGREGANRRGSEAAWPATVRWLRRHLEAG
jgi:carboxymethylenebutenolidase